MLSKANLTPAGLTQKDRLSPHFRLGCRPAAAAACQQRFSGRNLLPSAGFQMPKNLEILKKKVAFQTRQRHNVSSPWSPPSCRHLARILPGLPSL